MPRSFLSHWRISLARLKRPSSNPCLSIDVIGGKAGFSGMVFPFEQAINAAFTVGFDPSLDGGMSSVNCLGDVDDAPTPLLSQLPTLRYR